MPIEIQRIPGDFTFPTDWPKLTFSNVDKVVMDWWADDLDLGPLTTSWVDRVSGVEMVPTLLNDSWQPPVVKEGGAGGHRAVRFDGLSRLMATRDFKSSLAYSIVYKVDPATSSGARVVSGKMGFRSLLVASPSTNPSALTGQVATAPNVVVNTKTMYNMVMNQWQSAVISHSFGGNYSGQILNGPVFSMPSSTQEISQTDLVLGYNTAGTATLTAEFPVGLHGEISRFTVWDMGLSELEIDTVNKSNQKLFVLQ